jgi:uncharacterized membrane protein YcaP (DUF421 family)
MQDAGIFFDGWSKLGRSMILAVLAYIALVVLLRISGKRTLAKMNVYDFVFVVALGSTLATTILTPDITLADGVAALMALISLQYLFSWLCVISHRVDGIVNGEPTLVFYNGDFLAETMRKERVTREEVLAATRNVGLATLDSIDSVVLETDGTFSVVWERKEGERSSAVDVPGHGDHIPDEQRRKSHEG